MRKDRSPSIQSFSHLNRSACRVALGVCVAPLLFLTGLSLPTPLSAASFELSLKLEHRLNGTSPLQSAPTATGIEAESKALKMSESLSGPVQSAADKGTKKAEEDSALPGLVPFLTLIVRMLWFATGLFLLAHIAREWARVILVRLRREHKPLTLEYANWPTVTILVIPKGDAPAQEHRLDVLRTLPFDYPAERIHFVVAYKVEDIGVRDAVHRLGKALPEKVLMLPIEPDEDANLASLLPLALAKSVGTALVILDRNLPVPRDWLKQSVSPILDPAVGAVLNRAIPGQAHNAIATRLIALADHADVLLATQSDAIDLMLCGKARIRAIRRPAYKSIEPDVSNLTPDGASIVLDLVRNGWQTVLLADVQTPQPQISHDTIRSPRMHPSVSWQALRLAPLAFAQNFPHGARVQGRAVFFAAVLPLVWLCSLACGILLYALGDILWGGLAIALCAATSFDPLGHPKPAFSVAAAARMAGLREEIRLLPLACASFLDRIVDGCRVSLVRRRPFRPVHSGDPVIFQKEESA